MFADEHVKERPTLFLAMTGLTQAEFEHFLPDFQKAWEAYVRQTYIERVGRQRHYGGGKPETPLVPIADKLLFILYYLKVYPLQEILAFEFGMSQSSANDWIHILSGVLKTALAQGGHLPERDPEQLEKGLAAEPDATYGIDGTERRRQRPGDAEQQKHYYRGKKKRIPSRISSLAAAIRAKSIT